MSITETLMNPSRIAIGVSVVSLIFLVPMLAISYETAGGSSRRASPGINLATAIGDAGVAGVWSDGSTIWVVDDGDRALVAYDLATGAHRPRRKIELSSTNIGPRGIWSDGSVMWVADWDDDKLYAYDAADGTRRRSRDVKLDNANDAPEGVTGLRDTLLVVDQDDSYIYAYSAKDGSRQHAAEFDLHGSNDHPWGIWADQANVWVSDFKDEMLYGYALASGAHNSTTDLRLPFDNRDARGIWADGKTMWVVDDRDKHVYALRYRDYRQVGSELDIGGVQTPRGLWTDGDTMWVVDAGHAPHRQLAAYRVADGARVGVGDIRLDPLNRAPDAIWSDGSHIWVTDDEDRKVFVYELAVDGVRHLSKEFDLAPANTEARGIWADGEIMWVADAGEDRLYAYDLSARAQRPDREFDLAPHNGDAGGIWSDGQTIWVMDNSDRLAYAYDLATGSRRADADFRPVPLNDDLGALTGHGHRFWISDTRDNLLYAYAKSNAPPSFSEYSVRFDVHHSRSAGEAIGKIPEATDPDGDGLIYTPRGPDSALFNFDPETGVISYAGDAADFSAGKRFFFALSVSDGKDARYGSDPSPDDIVNVRIDVVPNAPARFNVRDGATLTISDDAPPGQVVAVADATDPDGDALTYSVLGHPRLPVRYSGGSFTLLPGKIRNASSPRSYPLTLLVRDDRDEHGDPKYTWDDQVDVIIRVVSAERGETIGPDASPPELASRPDRP